MLHFLTRKILLCSTFIFMFFFCNAPAEVLTAPSHGLRSVLLERHYVEIPLHRASKQDSLLISLSFGGEAHYLFILDTGATRSAIDKNIAAQFHFQSTGKLLTTTGAGGNKLWTYYVLIPKLQHGPHFESFYQPVVLMHSIPQEDEKPIVGIIGLDFLRKNQAVIDIPHHQVYLKPLGSNPLLSLDQPLQNTLLKLGYLIIPLQRTSNSHEAISVQINQAQPENFLLDTGAPVSVVDADYAQTLQLPTFGYTIEGQGSTGGQIKIYPAKVDKISIAGVEWNPEMFYITTGLRDVKAGIPIQGVIGMDWLRANHAILDTSNDFVFVRPHRKNEAFMKAPIRPRSIAEYR